MAALMVALAGCGERTVPDQSAAPPAGDTAAVTLEDTPFAADLGIDFQRMSRLEEGVYIEDVRAGTGAVAQDGHTVTVEYRAWLPDGTLYDQRPNADGWGPSEFVLGASAPVPGLSVGIPGMRTGGTRRIVVPPAQGYGLVGRPAPVPAGSPLIFEVRLLDTRE